MSITGILEEGKRGQSRIYGVVVGIVTNNQDPDKLGRVKVKIPRLSADDESQWARVATLMAGKNRGAFFLPEVDDEVLVAFEHGDMALPYVIGALWNGLDEPPETNDDGKNNIRVITSRSGSVIRLDDTDGDEKIEIIDKEKKNGITISTKDNTIRVKTEKDLVISAPNGKVTIEAKDLDIKTNASVTVKASGNANVEASGTMTIKGATVNIN
jgi:uncharacterized protein involved in type VI secretion and phage assembly